MRDEPLTYTATPGRHEGAVLLTVTGPLVLSNMFALQTEIRSLKPQSLILDLAATPYMDSAGLGLIMNYYVSAQGSGRRLLLAAVNERVRALLELTKVDSLLSVYPSVEAAEASL